SFVAGLALIPFVPRGLIPRLDRGEFKIVFHLEPSALAPSATGQAPIDRREVAMRLENFARSFPEVKSICTLVGTSEGDPTRGVLYVRLNEDRKRHTAEIEDLLRQKLPRI